MMLEDASSWQHLSSLVVVVGGDGGWWWVVVVVVVVVMVDSMATHCVRNIVS